MIKYKSVICLISLSIFGCSIVKTPEIIKVSKIDGIVDVGYEYTWLEKPKINWDEINIKVAEKCRSLGYQPAVPSNKHEEICKESKRNGNCKRIFVLDRFECQLTADQITKKNEYYSKIKNNEKIKQELDKKNKYEEAKKSGTFIFHSDESDMNTIDKKDFLDMCRLTNYLDISQYSLVAMLVDNNAYELINETGNSIANLKDIYVKDNLCMVNFTFNGVYKGTTINDNIFCSAWKISKMENDNYIIDGLGYTDCKKR
jgi:hypothetical protein